jgi:predicted Holliday junction resolvase-like endonuclease
MKNKNEINFEVLQAKVNLAAGHAYSAFANFFMLEMKKGNADVERTKTAFDEIDTFFKNVTEKQNQQKENEQKTADVNNILNGESNYWKDAVKFSESLVVDGIEEKFANYCKEHNFNHNERILFRKFLADAIEFKFTIATLKHLT